MRDAWGVKCRHEIGVDILLWGSDFAHATGDWPNSQRLLDETFVGVAPPERQKMVLDNAVNYFHLDASADLDRYGQSDAGDDDREVRCAAVGIAGGTGEVVWVVAYEIFRE